MLATFSLMAEQLQETWAVPHYLGERIVDKHARRSKHRLCRIADIAETNSGQYVDQYFSSGTRYVRVDTIRRLILNENPADCAYVRVDALPSAVVPRCSCVNGDVLIARTGTLGKASLVTDRFHLAFLSQHITRLSVRRDGPVLAGCLCLFLNSELGSCQLVNKGMGSSRLELTHESLAGIRIPILERRRQLSFDQRLRRALKTYYESVDTLSQLVELADQFIGIDQPPQTDTGDVDDLPLFPTGRTRRTHSYSLPTGELDNIWIPRRFRPETLGTIQKIEQSFPCVRLGDLAVITRGKGTTTAEYRSSGIPFLRTTTLVNLGIDPFPDHYADEATYESFGQAIQDGDIVYSIEGKIGSAAMLFGFAPVVLKNHIELVRISKVPEPFRIDQLSGWVFLMLAGRLGQAQAAVNTVVQSTIPGLASRLREYKIPLPKESVRPQSLGAKAFETTCELARTVKELNVIQADFNRQLFAESI